MKRFGSLIVVLCLMLCAVQTAWTAGQDEKVSDSAAATEVERTKIPRFTPPSLPAKSFHNVYTLPIAPEPTTITVGRYGWAGAYTENMKPENIVELYPNRKYLYENTNIIFEYDIVVGQNAYDESMIPRLAAGTDLPDLIQMPGGLDLMAAVDAGKFADMRPYIEEHGPNFQAYLKRRPDIQSLVTAPDGGIYFWASTTSSAYPYGVIFRGDWLQKIGREVAESYEQYRAGVKVETPETIDDYVTVLRAFRDNDMNGDGDPSDEMPQGTPWLSTLVTYHAGSWGLQAGSWQADDYGVLSYTYTHPRYKEMLEWLKMLYAEKLIPQDLNTAYGGDYYKWGSPNIGAYLTRRGADGSEGPGTQAPWYEAKGIYGAWMIGASPLIGPHGDRGTFVRQGLIGRPYAINAQISDEKKEYIVKLFDYFLTRDGMLTLLFGPPENYTFDSNGNPVLKPEINESPDRNALTQGARINPHVAFDEYYFQYLFSKLGGERIKEDLQFAVPQVQFSSYSYPSEDEVYKQYWSGEEGISAYASSMMKKFVTGEEPLTNWDAYVAQIERLGIAEVLKVSQAKYDRMLRAAGYLE